MSLIAGAYSRFRGRPLPNGLEHALGRAVSRRPGVARSVWASLGVALVHCETGAYTKPAFIRDGDHAVTAVAGDPLLAGSADGTAAVRVEDTRRLHDAFRRGDLTLLASTTGHFAAVHYDAADHQLVLAVDRTGFRPLYYWVGDELVVFASAQHIIRALGVVPKLLNIGAALQLAAFGFIPGNDTPYANVRMPGPAEVLQFDGRRMTVHRYFHWDRIRTSDAPDEDLADTVMAALGRAIDRRLGPDRTSVAFLTGGMDTRLVVCELLKRGVHLHTLNGAFPGQQDQAYARLFADAVGAMHQEMPGQIADVAYPDRMARTFLASAARAAVPPDRPHCVWTGVGGSLAIGGVGLDAGLLAKIRTERPRAAIESIVAQEGYALPRRVLTPAARTQFEHVIEEGLLAAFNSYDVDDPAKRLWLFTVLNEYRRAYASNLEDIDQHQCESLVPLCDPDLLAVLASVPIERLLGHAFYMRLVARTDGRFFAAPWQTYPGHPECSVQGVPELPTQWDMASRPPVRDGLPRRVLRQLFSRTFPAGLLGRGRMLSAVGLELLGLRDTRHALRFADVLQGLASTCDSGGAQNSPVRSEPPAVDRRKAIQSRVLQLP